MTIDAFNAQIADAASAYADEDRQRVEQAGEVAGVSIPPDAVGLARERAREGFAAGAYWLVRILTAQEDEQQKKHADSERDRPRRFKRA